MNEIIIVDDEKHCVNLLVKLIEKVAPYLSIKKTFTNPVEALDYMQNAPHFDLLFIDIKMPQLNGFDLLNQIKEINFGVVFTTAFDNFAIRAFQYSAINYLLKPISKKDIAATLQLWEERSLKISREQFEILQNKLSKKYAIKDEKIVLSTQEGQHIVLLKDIVRCEADNNYTKFFLKDSSNLIISKTLKKIEEMLNEHHFIRLHQSHLVSIKSIAQLNKKNGHTSVVLKNKDEIPVSRNKINTIKEKLNL